jgi:hypothetical protein
VQLFKVPHHCLRNGEDGCKVHVQDRVVILLGDLPKWGVLLQASVINEDVELSQFDALLR